jgi:hypothetical protein
MQQFSFGKIFYKFWKQSLNRRKPKQGDSLTESIFSENPSLLDAKQEYDFAQFLPHYWWFLSFGHGRQRALAAF